jgi:hypothetical protein
MIREGVLTSYETIGSRTLLFIRDPDDTFNRAFLEWYASWKDLKEFEHFSSLYIQDGKSRPAWAELYQIVKFSYSHPSLLLEGKRWEEEFETFYFSTVDFLVNGDKVQLCEYDIEFWSDLYTPEQASFRYYDILNDSIGFLTPRDLLINHEI